MNISSNSEKLIHSLKIKARAKINLHLEVLGLRLDGFHELAMVMQSIDLADQIQIVSNLDGLIQLNIDDPNLSANDENLIIKAAKLLRSHVKKKNLGATISLQKNIPIGAGLAGGSSDGAATLLGLNYMWNLNLANKELKELASQLGSDIPFCIDGGSQLCFGRGEILEPLKNFSNDLSIILVKDPLVSVSTPWAYKRYKDVRGSSYLNSEPAFEQRRQLLRKATWLDLNGDSPSIPLNNDLQKVVAPEIESVGNALKLLASFPGSIGVAMSGSGPSCFALYSTHKHALEVYDQNRWQLEAAGLESWCCSFQSECVTFDG